VTEVEAAQPPALVDLAETSLPEAEGMGARKGSAWAWERRSEVSAGDDRAIAEGELSRIATPDGNQ
jgi:hypothetical protein